MGKHGFDASIVVEHPVEGVFEFLADLENDSTWRREWIESRRTSEGPLGVGVTFRLVGKALGRRFTIDYEVTDWEPNRTAAWKALSGPLPLRFRRSFSSEGNGTRIDFRYDADQPAWFLRPLGTVMAPIGRRQLEGDFPQLRTVLHER